jgi:hypothetical protein
MRKPRAGGDKACQDEKQLRRWITLISAGRNRIIMIRREPPRTENAGWVRRPDRTKDRRILLFERSRSVTALSAAARG